MKCCAVVDINVIVSALLSKKEDAATVQVFRAMLGGRFTPLYHEDILDEYEEVLHRPKCPPFGQPDTSSLLFRAIKSAPWLRILLSPR